MKNGSDRNSETREGQCSAAVTEAPAEEETATAAAQVVPVPEIDLAPETLADYDYLMNHFFIVDSATETTAEQINAASFLAEDLTLQKKQRHRRFLFITAIHRRLSAIQGKGKRKTRSSEWELISQNFFQKRTAIR